MTEDGTIVQAAHYLVQRYTARESLDILRQDFAPTTVEDACKVQDAFLGMLGQAKGPLGGYKIASTSDAMRRLRGIRSPCAGGMFAATMHDAPATLHDADYVKLAIECEVAVSIGTDVPASQAPDVRESLAESITCLAVAFELVDLRGAAAGTGQDAAAIAGICTNIANAGAVVGPAVREWRRLD